MKTSPVTRSVGTGVVLDPFLPSVRVCLLTVQSTESTSLNPSLTWYNSFFTVSLCLPLLCAVDSVSGTDGNRGGD